VWRMAARFARVSGGRAVTSEAVLRRVRALMLPTVLFASGLAGHAAAGGVTPAPSVLVPLFVLTVVVVAQFREVPISPGRCMALLVGGQGLLHAALQLLGGTVTATTTLGDTAAGMATGSSLASSHLMMHQGATASHGLVMSLMSGGHVIMLLAHLAAGLVVGAWLAAGERACRTLLALTARPVIEAWRVITSAGQRATRTVVARCPKLTPGWGLPAALSGSMWVTGVVPRRGPPGTASPEPHAYANVLTV
jgi:hypothetical protein